MKNINWQSVHHNLSRSAQALQAQHSLRPELLEARARRLARPLERQHSALLHVLHLRLGAEDFALALQDLQEVRSAAACTPLPLARAELSGIYPWRGQMVSVLDLALLLKLASAAGPGDMIVFLRQSAPLGLRVSQLGEWESLSFKDLQAVTDSQSPLSYTGPGGLRVLNAEWLRQHPALRDEGF